MCLSLFVTAILRIWAQKTEGVAVYDLFGHCVAVIAAVAVAILLVAALAAGQNHIYARSED